MTRSTTFSNRLQTLRTGLSRYVGERSLLVRLARRHRRIFCLSLCGGLSVLSFLLAFVIRFQLSNFDASLTAWQPWFLKTVGLVLVVRVASFMMFSLHRISWRYASAHDVVPVLAAVSLSTLVLVPSVMFLWGGFFPRSVLVIDAVLCLLIITGARFSYRLADEILVGVGATPRAKVIVIGAGAAGNLTVRAMVSRGLVDYWPVAILDDDPLKHGTTLQGIPVTGPVSSVAEEARRTGAEALVLALPTATSSEFYKVVQACKKTGLPLKTTPDLAQILHSSNVVTRISDFRLEDLLHRRPIRSDLPEIADFLSGRTVLVTGAAGSIGSELCRQIAEHDIQRLVCLDKDENGLFRLEHQLKVIAPEVQVVFHLGDVKDITRMTEAFATWRPDVVFHAAAYKHVPVLQHHPVEAIRNNVAGTQVVAELSDRFSVANFVLISTDKAVNPTSVMGATKRIAERIVRSRDRNSDTSFSIIRFGNVLGSAGSVVELFMNQIRAGRPVTVTHPDMERYFMTIPEAVHLVLFSATMGRGGETFILDMGNPVKIVSLARQIIRLSGLTPEVDVPIQFTGLRPGEKLYEELWTAQETPQPTRHPGIRRAPSDEHLPEDLAREVADLLEAANANQIDGCWQSLLTLVPTFQGRTNGEAALPPAVKADSSES